VLGRIRSNLSGRLGEMQKDLPMNHGDVRHE
jgi:hypothetical protein